MSNTEPTETDMSEEHPDSPGVRELREALKRKESEAAEGAAAKRELAFFKAGIDGSKPQHQLLLKAYDGELDPDAIKAAAAEYGLLDVEDPSPPVDASETQERRALGAEAADPATPSDVPTIELAYDAYRGELANGKTQEEASAAVLGAIFARAREGDPRFVFDAADWQGSEAARSR